jgi:aspartate carbamoyltransferase catalytic subunit
MCSDLSSACRGADVLYVTRIQKERFDYPEEYEKVKVRVVANGKTPLTRMLSHSCAPSAFLP